MSCPALWTLDSDNINTVFSILIREIYVIVKIKGPHIKRLLFVHTFREAKRRQMREGEKTRDEKQNRKESRVRKVYKRMEAAREE